MAEVSPSPADGNLSPKAESPRVANGDLDFEQHYDRLTNSATQIWSRYEQICRDQARQMELKQQLGSKTIVPQDLGQDLKSLQTELDNLDMALESQLISWDSFREVFWQAVRFGGLGVAIGWGLKSWAG